MKLFRYRSPSVRGLLGITRARRSILRVSGLNAILYPFRAPGYLLRRAKRRSGYYSVKRLTSGRIPGLLTGIHLPSLETPLARVSGLVGGLACLWVLAVWLSSLGRSLPGAKPSASAPSLPRSASRPGNVIRYKNGRRLTPEQVAAQDAYVARARAKRERLLREEEKKEAELRRAMAALAVADAQWRARNSAPQQAAGAELTPAPEEEPAALLQYSQPLAMEPTSPAPSSALPRAQVQIVPSPEIPAYSAAPVETRFAGEEFASPYSPPAQPKSYYTPAPSLPRPSHSTHRTRIYRNSRGVTYTYPYRGR